MKQEDIEKFIEGKRAVLVRYKNHENKNEDFICDTPKVTKRSGVPILISGNGVESLNITEINGLKNVNISEEEWYQGEQ